MYVKGFIVVAMPFEGGYTIVCEAVISWYKLLWGMCNFAYGVLFCVFALYRGLLLSSVCMQQGSRVFLS